MIRRFETARMREPSRWVVQRFTGGMEQALRDAVFRFFSEGFRHRCEEAIAAKFTELIYIGQDGSFISQRCGSAFRSNIEESCSADVIKCIVQRLPFLIFKRQYAVTV